MSTQTSQATADVAPTPAEVVAPCVPTGGAMSASRPLGLTDVTLTGGFWADRQRVNADVSIPLAQHRLEDAGNMHDLRLAAGLVESDGTPGHGFQGPFFMDSDLYKSIEAAAWEAGRSGGPPAMELVGWIEQAAELLEAAQADDGYLNSYVQVVTHARYARLEHSHELYCAGHLFQAAVAAARSTADERLLGVARRLADHLVATFGPAAADNHALDGHPEAETALVELYRLTGTHAYLELAMHFVRSRGHRHINHGYDSSYFIDALPADTADSLLGHAVRALYFDAGVVDVAVETHDNVLLAAVERRWEDMVSAKTAITGGVGSRHSREAFGDRFELPPDRAYNEPCAAIASIMVSWRLLLATGRARYAELIERTLVNNLAASVSVGGDRFFYVNPLQRRRDHAEGDDHAGGAHGGDPGRRRQWFACACCPPNIMRLVASLAAYVTSVSADSRRLYLHQFVSAHVGSHGWDLDVTSALPAGGQVCIVVHAAPAGLAELAVRHPTWSAATTVAVNGVPVPAAPDADGYLVLERTWAAGDVVDLTLDVTPRLVRADPRVDALAGAAAIVTGPLVHCLEALDQPAGTDLARVDIAADATLSVETVSVDGVGTVPVVSVDAQTWAAPAPTPACWPYREIQHADHGCALARRPVRLRTMPYHGWDNRDPGAMRVWIPLR